MEFKEFTDPEEYWQLTAEALKEEEAKNSLCLGLSNTFRTQPEGCLYQSALFEKGKLLGSVVLSQYKTNSNFLPTPVKNKIVAQHLFKNFQQSGQSATGIVGEKLTADIYRDLFEEAGFKTSVNMTQGLYRCTSVIMPPPIKSTQFRQAQLEDVKKLGQFVNGFHKEATPHDPPVIGEEVAEAKVKGCMFYVLEEQGEIISMVGWGRDIGTSCSVNFVYTPPQHRKRGLGSLTTALLTQKLLSEGRKETCLYTDMTNPTSNKIYQNIGYKFVCDSVHYGLKKP